MRIGVVLERVGSGLSFKGGRRRRTLKSRGGRVSQEPDCPLGVCLSVGSADRGRWSAHAIEDHAIPPLAVQRSQGRVHGGVDKTVGMKVGGAFQPGQRAVGLAEPGVGGWPILDRRAMPRRARPCGSAARPPPSPS